MIEPGDMVIFFNYRNDRAKELTIALTQRDIPEQQMKKMPLYYCCMTPYDATFEGLHILFNKENVENTLGEVISKAGLKQLKAKAGFWCLRRKWLPMIYNPRCRLLKWRKN